ncbi:MAG: 2-dehydro-3-deoxy-6-phosphogalactonate aldolase, partial [Deltaproteobacteria bacterium]
MSVLIDALSPLPLLAILRGLPAAEAPSVADRLLAAGLRVLEVPLNRPGAVDSLRAQDRRDSAERGRARRGG